jgi:hypothetical protein
MSTRKPAVSRLRAALRKDPATGKPIASRFGGGSYDALKHVPQSLKRHDSRYRRLLVTLGEIRASNTPCRTAEEITVLFNIKYNQNQSLASVAKMLSRFLIWQFLDYVERPRDKRGGYWALKDEIDINDIHGLLLRAKTAAKLLSAMPDECVAALTKSFDFVER